MYDYVYTIIERNIKMHSKKIAGFIIGSIGVGIVAGVALAVKSIIEDRVDLTVVTDKISEIDESDISDDTDEYCQADVLAKESDDKIRKYTDVHNNKADNINNLDYYFVPSKSTKSELIKKSSKVLKEYNEFNSLNNNTDYDEPPVNPMSSDFDDDEMDLSNLDFDNSTDL